MIAIDGHLRKQKMMIYGKRVSRAVNVSQLEIYRIEFYGETVGYCWGEIVDSAGVSIHPIIDCLWLLSNSNTAAINTGRGIQRQNDLFGFVSFADFFDMLPEWIVGG